MSNDRPAPLRVALGKERLIVGKQVEDRGRVKVRTRVHVDEETVTADLSSEEVTVERVAINREVQAAPEVRQEGDLVIVPIVEEEVVVSKRLVLKEELRIRRRTITRQVEQTVSVRRSSAIVERDPPAEGQPEPEETEHGSNHHSPVRHEGTR